MFLGELKSEQKELFLDLGICLSMSDGDFSALEKKMILEMCKEMGISERLDAKLDFKDAIEKIKEGITTREKRIILLETAGIVLADGEYSDDEMSVMKEIAATLEIDYSQVEEVVATVNNLLDVYSKIGEFLTKK